MTNIEARYAIFSAIEMGDKIDASCEPYFSVLLCAEKALDKLEEIKELIENWNGGLADEIRKILSEVE